MASLHAISTSDGKSYFLVKNVFNLINRRSLRYGDFLLAKLSLVPEADLRLLHSGHVQIHGAKINALADSLDDEAIKPEAIGLLRELIIEVHMTSETAALNSHIINLQ